MSFNKVLIRGSILYIFLVLLFRCCHAAPTNTLKTALKIDIRVCEQFMVVPSDEHEREMRKEVEAAIKYWNKALGKEVFIYEEEDVKEGMRIVFFELVPIIFSETGLTKGYIYVSANKFNGCASDTIMVFDETFIKEMPWVAETLIRHELGHLLGLAHPKDKITPTLMRSTLSSIELLHPLEATEKEIDHIKSMLFKKGEIDIGKYLGGIE